MKVVAIETSCDETSLAYLEDERVLHSKTYSQVRLHASFGGVNPSIARREHEKRLPALWDQLAQKIDIRKEVDALAVTYGPGLPPSLETGVSFAKEKALLLGLPLIPVNHLEGHIASIFLQRRTGNDYLAGKRLLQFPLLQVLISGGHSDLVLSSQDKQGAISHQLIGQTLDDAAGEVLDKVGRELGLGYPAAPVLEKIAKNGDPSAIEFPLPMKYSAKDNLDMSFSGLKTKAMQILHGTHAISSSSQRDPLTLDAQALADFAASFQHAVVSAICFKVLRAVKLHGSTQVTLSGGVAANMYLRAQLRDKLKKHRARLFCTHPAFTGDNAAMIGLAAQWAAKRGEILRTSKEIESLDRKPNLHV